MKGTKNGKGGVIDQLKQQIKVQIEEDDEIQELSFSGIPIVQFTPEIMALLNKYEKIISFEFTDCQLKTLDGFNASKNLIKLCFEKNELDGTSIKFLADNYPDLQFLSLSVNKIANLEDLQPLKQFPSLMQLDLQENPLTKVPKYSETAFTLCNKLEILDNKDSEGNEAQYSEEDPDRDDAEIDDDSEDDDYTEDEQEESQDEESEEEPPKKRGRK